MIILTGLAACDGALSSMGLSPSFAIETTRRWLPYTICNMQRACLLLCKKIIGSIYNHPCLNFSLGGGRV